MEEKFSRQQKPLPMHRAAGPLPPLPLLLCCNCCLVHICLDSWFMSCAVLCSHGCC